MAYYRELDDILNIVIGKYILKNQRLCKLLYYYPEEDVFNYNPLTQPNIPDTSVLLLKHIFPMPKSPDIETEQKCFLTVVLTGSNEISTNQGFKKANLVFDIVCHLDAWMIKSSYRPYKIAEEIDIMFNNKLVDLPIETNPVSYNFKVRDYSSQFYGLQLVYEVTINSNVQCFTLPRITEYMHGGSGSGGYMPYIPDEPDSGTRIRDYNALDNKPSIENVILQDNKTFKQLGMEEMTDSEIERILYLNDDIFGG
jgi:hypothetical protein